MRLKKIDGDFTVCKIKNASDIDFSQEYCFVGKTEEELSLVCQTEHMPDEVIEFEEGWRGFRIDEQLDFSLIGILSKISGILAEHKIGLFAVSTYNTDYIFVKKENYEKALSVLEENGFQI